ncbi:MAG: 16S rRNA (uracil(1498)-N(3))-methyltransferase [Pyrinomonadaceae bacterium]
MHEKSACWKTMTRRRFFAPPGAFAEDAVTLAPEEARHLRDVLRLEAGDEAFVFDGEGREYRCTIREIGRGRDATAVLEVRESVAAASNESPLQLTLGLALLKGEKFDLVVQKATELGVMRIMPVVTTRSDVRLRDAADAQRRRARWQRVALEAAKQSGRARVPQIDEPITFEKLMESLSASDETPRVMFAERAGGKLSDAVAEWRSGKSVGLVALVGAEGGWTDEEIARASQAGWRVVTLGGRILRAETAAITVTALLQHLCGDLI